MSNEIKIDPSKLPVVGVDSIKTVQDARRVINQMMKTYGAFCLGIHLPDLLNKLDAMTDTWVEVVAQTTALEVKRALTVDREPVAPRASMVYVHVMSEMISRVGYNRATRELLIVFHDRYGAETSEFSYLEVSEWVYAELIDEDNSAGETYNEYVKGNYDGRRCVSIGGRRMTETEAEAYRSPSGRRSRRLRFGR